MRLNDVHHARVHPHRARKLETPFLGWRKRKNFGVGGLELNEDIERAERK